MYFSACAVVVLLAGLAVMPLPGAAGVARRHAKIGGRCTGAIHSYADVSAAEICPTINIYAFTVPAGKTLAISALTGATINLLGNVTFAVYHGNGPLFTLSGSGVTFNGNGYTFNGQGASYWDGRGLSGGKAKPAPMLQFVCTGFVSNFKVLNSPARAISLSNSKSSLLMSNVTVDNSAGSSLGHNTDCWDISATGGTTVENSMCINQDDCLAVNRGNDITFKDNFCRGGHGISIGSISSGVTVSNVQIIRNTICSSANALRIKTVAAATRSTVSDITYINNTAYDISKYGVIIDQSYPTTNGAPGKGVIISGVTFHGANMIAVNSGANSILVNCHIKTCTGWNWPGLNVTGGAASVIKNAQIQGASY